MYASMPDQNTAPNPNPTFTSHLLLFCQYCDLDGNHLQDTRSLSYYNIRVFSEVTLLTLPGAPGNPVNAP